jgi:hypothetical protein
LPDASEVLPDDGGRKQYRLISARLHAAASEKTAIFILAAVNAEISRGYKILM